ncbi:MAG: hypothetical protein OSA98_14220 [Rubripirellula sp.]|nr:hypothetical protein [Rubripirellula sp.]
MNVQFTSQLQRFHFSLILTLTLTVTTVIAASSAFAERFDASNDIIPIRSDNTITGQQFVEQQQSDWVSIGTHDSGPLPTLAPPPLIAARPDRDTGPPLEPQVAVNQVIEPFAAVGPSLFNSIKAVRILQQWWDSEFNDSDAGSGHPSDPIEMQLHELATQEPVDIDSLGPSVLVPTNPQRKPESIEVTRIDPLIGSSPIIATIEEDYMPYDLSARDLRLWSVFPIASHPFCVRGQLEDNRSARLWDDFDNALAQTKSPTTTAMSSNDKNSDSTESSSSPSDLTSYPLDSLVTDGKQDKANVDNLAAQEPLATMTAESALATLKTPQAVPLRKASPSVQEIAATRSELVTKTPFLCGSADCLLEELVWKAETITAMDSLRDGSKLSSSIGILLANQTKTASQWLSDRAFRITARWPNPDRDRDHSRSGAKLLARAGTLESGVVEENILATHEPIERLDGIDCGSQTTLQVATANGDARSR